MPGPFLNIGQFSTSVSQNDTVQKEELGVWRFEGGRVLRYVRSGAVIPQFSAVTAQTNLATAALFGNQVIPTSARTHMLFGVADNSAFASGSFGWITVFGVATGRTTTGTTPGTVLQPGTATGVLDVWASTNLQAFALALQTGLSAGSAVFVRAL